MNLSGDTAGLLLSGRKLMRAKLRRLMEIIPMTTARLAWHHFIFETPSDWETLGYRNDPIKGQIVLANRRGEVLHIFWRQLKEKTGVRNRLVNVALELSEDEDLKAGEIRKSIVEQHGWQVYHPKRENHPTLAGRCEDDTKVLMYLVFPPHPDTREKLVIDRLLKSYEQNEGDELVWAFIGVDVTMPAEYELKKIEALPAAQVLHFENNRGEKAFVHRYGLVDQLLSNIDMAKFYAGLNKRKNFYNDGNFYYKDKYPGVKLKYTTRGKGGLEAMTARTWQGRAWVWRCDDLQRLYCVDTNALEDHLLWDLPDRVRCR